MKRATKEKRRVSWADASFYMGNLNYFKIPFRLSVISNTECLIEFDSITTEQAEKLPKKIKMFLMGRNDNEQ